MIRYRNVAPKYLYYLVLFLNIITGTLFTILFPKVIRHEDLILLIIFMLIASIWLLQFIFLFLNKVIYLKIDLIDKKVLYGNLFMSNEASFQDIHSVEKKWWHRATTIQINQNKYKVSLLTGTKPDELRKLFALE